MKDEIIKIGRIFKPHGLTGELKVAVEEEYVADMLNTGVVFILQQGKPAPFFVEYLKEGSNSRIKIEDISSPEAAMKISSKDLFMRESDISKKVEKEGNEELEPEDLVGFLISEVNDGELGEIVSVLELPSQYMAVVIIEEKEVLIPLHEVYIQALDPDEKTILLELPEGLLDLNKG